VCGKAAALAGVIVGALEQILDPHRIGGLALLVGLHEVLGLACERRDLSRLL
jgi:hypothetical protein